jgi:hypothetical protein
MTSPQNVNIGQYKGKIAKGTLAEITDVGNAVRCYARIPGAQLTSSMHVQPDITLLHFSGLVCSVEAFKRSQSHMHPARSCCARLWFTRWQVSRGDGALDEGRGIGNERKHPLCLHTVHKSTSHGFTSFLLPQLSSLNDIQREQFSIGVPWNFGIYRDIVM